MRLLSFLLGRMTKRCFFVFLRVEKTKDLGEILRKFFVAVQRFV